MPLSATCPFMFLTTLFAGSTSGSKPSSFSTASRISLVLLTCPHSSVAGEAADRRSPFSPPHKLAADKPAVAIRDVVRGGREPCRRSPSPDPAGSVGPCPYDVDAGPLAPRWDGFRKARVIGRNYHDIGLLPPASMDPATATGTATPPRSGDPPAPRPRHAIGGRGYRAGGTTSIRPAEIMPRRGGMDAGHWRGHPPRAVGTVGCLVHAGMDGEDTDQSRPGGAGSPPAGLAAAIRGRAAAPGSARGPMATRSST